MLIVIGSDHRGSLLKNQLVLEIVSLGFSVRDYGSYKNSKNPDYPDYAARVAKAIVKDNALGILLCGTGIGMCITANKFVGVRAALCYDEFTAKLAKERYNSNCICIGSDSKNYKEVVTTWLKTPFSNKAQFKRQLKQVESIREQKRNYQSS